MPVNRHLEHFMGGFQREHQRTTIGLADLRGRPQ
jgi:hypothetical protein